MDYFTTRLAVRLKDQFLPFPWFRFLPSKIHSAYENFRNYFAFFALKAEPDFKTRLQIRRRCGLDHGEHHLSTLGRKSKKLIRAQKSKYPENSTDL